MGIFHTRASRKRDRARARLLNEQARVIRDERQPLRQENRARIAQGVEGLPWWRQPTVGAAIAAWQRDHRAA